MVHDVAVALPDPDSRATDAPRGALHTLAVPDCAGRTCLSEETRNRSWFAPKSLTHLLPLENLLQGTQRSSRGSGESYSTPSTTSPKRPTTSFLASLYRTMTPSPMSMPTAAFGSPTEREDVGLFIPGPELPVTTSSPWNPLARLRALGDLCVRTGSGLSPRPPRGPFSLAKITQRQRWVPGAPRRAQSGMGIQKAIPRCLSLRSLRIRCQQGAEPAGVKATLRPSSTVYGPSSILVSPQLHNPHSRHQPLCPSVPLPLSTVHRPRSPAPLLPRPSAPLPLFSALTPASGF